MIALLVSPFILQLLLLLTLTTSCDVSAVLTITSDLLQSKFTHDLIGIVLLYHLHQAYRIQWVSRSSCETCSTIHERSGSDFTRSGETGAHYCTNPEAPHCNGPHTALQPINTCLPYGVHYWWVLFRGSSGDILNLCSLFC